MKALHLFATSALAAALASPSLASAEPPTFGQPPSSVQATAATPTPSARRGHHGRFMHLLRELNLSADQTQRIQGLVQQYRAAHPKGSPKDRQAAKALRGQILAVLTPEQQARLKTLRKSARGTPKHHQ